MTTSKFGDKHLKLGRHSKLCLPKNICRGGNKKRFLLTFLINSLNPLVYLFRHVRIFHITSSLRIQLRSYIDIFQIILCHRRIIRQRYFRISQYLLRCNSNSYQVFVLKVDHLSLKKQQSKDDVFINFLLFYEFRHLGSLG